MEFNSPLFLVFFCAFFLFYHFVAARRQSRLRLIVAASLIYYGSWSWPFVPVLFLLGAANFFLAPGISREADPLRKRRRLAAVLVLDAAPLILLKCAGLPSIPALPGIVVPVGVSFYTLQCVSYAVDVYRGSLTPCANFFEFMAALTFFPRLAAGPLVRWADWLPQFECAGVRDWRAVERGFLLVSFGLFKLAAGSLLAPAADAAFTSAAPPSAPAAWAGVLAFAAQIYGQFAGISDVAIGTALLLGFSLPPNFDLPFAAASPIEFWRRWHMSLYAWLYEYIYLPLALRFRANLLACLFATVLFAGLWHGFRWTFAFYGLYHAVLLAVTYALFARPALRASWLERSWAARLVSTAATVYFVLLGLAIFRAATLRQAWGAWRGLHGLGAAAAWTPKDLETACLAVAVLVFCHGIDWAARDGGILRRPWLLWPAAAVGLGVCFATGARADFAYFH